MEAEQVCCATRGRESRSLRDLQSLREHSWGQAVEYEEEAGGLQSEQQRLQ